MGLYFVFVFGLEFHTQTQTPVPSLFETLTLEPGHSFVPTYQYLHKPRSAKFRSIHIYFRPNHYTTLTAIIFKAENVWVYASFTQNKAFPITTPMEHLWNCVNLNLKKKTELFYMQMDGGVLRIIKNLILWLEVKTRANMSCNDSVAAILTLIKLHSMDICSCYDPWLLRAETWTHAHDVTVSDGERNQAHTGEVTCFLLLIC